MWEHKLKGAMCLVYYTDFYCFLNIGALAGWMSNPVLKLARLSVFKFNQSWSSSAVLDFSLLVKDIHSILLNT